MLEWRLSKEQILELYLNRVHLGAGTYGVEKMSRHLFGKPARELTLAESALIAGLIQRPSALSPWSNLAGARARSHVVLQRMREEGFITEAEESCKSGALAASLPAIGPRGQRLRQAVCPAAVPRHLRRRSSSRLEGENTIRGPAERSGEGRRARLERIGRRDLQAALVAVRPENGTS